MGNVFIVVAGKGEFLPNHNAVFVAVVIENILLNACAAPHSKYIHIRLSRKANHILVMLICYITGENIGFNNIGALGKNLSAVKANCNRGACAAFGKIGKLIPRALVGYKLGTPKANGSAFFAGCAFGSPAVKVLFTLAAAPPKIWVLQGKAAV